MWWCLSTLKADKKDLAVIINLRLISHWGSSELPQATGELSINGILEVSGAGFLQKSEVTTAGG